ncbi:hypothetical protein BH23ACT5_BH23ACT5_22170 [soil metagenome]
MRGARLLLGLLAVALMSVPSAALAQTGEIEIVEVNTARYSDGGQVTMVVGFRGFGAQIDPEQLSVTADGAGVENLVVEPLASSTVPVGVVLAIDTSGSMQGEPIAAARDAARSFVEQKRPEDFVAIVRFDEEAQVIQGFTNNTATLLSRIDSLNAAGATAFNDAVITAIGLFESGPATSLQPNIIILADGDDNGSNATAAEVQEAVADSDARIFSVALEPPEEFDFNPAALEAIANQSGGLFLEAPDPSQLGGLYGQIQSEIANVLVARFAVPSPAPGEVAFAIDYAGISAESVAQVSGFVTTTLASEAAPPATFAPPVIHVIESSLPADPQTLALIGALGTGAALALFVWILFGRREEEGGGAFAKRLAAYGRKGGAEEQVKKGLIDRLPLLRRFSQAAEAEVKRRGLLAGMNSALEQANIPLSPGEAIMAAFGLSIVAGLLGTLVYGPAGGLIVFLLAIVVVFGFIKWAGSREKRRFETQLPDTLTLLSTSLRAGYSLLQAVEAVAAEAPDPTAREYGRAIAEARLGRSVTEALDGITERTQSKDFEWAVMAIEIQREVGGNLAEVLQTVADTMLQRNRIRGEIRAMTAEGRISAFVLGSLPFVMGLFLWANNPDYIRPLFENTMGLVALGAGVVLMAGGILWLRKIINIDV